MDATKGCPCTPVCGPLSLVLILSCLNGNALLQGDNGNQKIEKTLPFLERCNYFLVVGADRLRDESDFEFII